MGFIELLVVLSIMLVLYTTEAIDPRDKLLWALVGAGTVLIVFLFFHFLARKFSMALLGEGPINIRRYRKRLKTKSLLREKRYLDAEAYLKELLRRDPSDNEASRALSELYMQQKRYEEFIAEKERYLREGYRIPVHEKSAAYNRIADLYLTHFNNLDRALMALNQIVLDFPNSKEATFARKRMNDIVERLQRQREESEPDD
jgi:tetratricopeptide (TPR) repeat protein